MFAWKAPTVYHQRRIPTILLAREHNHTLAAGHHSLMQYQMVCVRLHTYSNRSHCTS